MTLRKLPKMASIQYEPGKNLYVTHDKDCFPSESNQKHRDVIYKMLTITEGFVLNYKPQTRK